MRLRRASSGPEDQRILQQNVAAGLWLALLIGIGQFVLYELAENARHEECLMRGALPCSKVVHMGLTSWDQYDWYTRQRESLAERLKSQRPW